MGNMKHYTLQIRKPGRAYRTVETSTDAASIRWAFDQHLVPYGESSVRILDTNGAVIMRATPKQ